MSKDAPQRGFCCSQSFSIQKHTQQHVPKIALCHAQSINNLCDNFGLQFLPHLNTLSKQENVNAIPIPYWIWQNNGANYVKIWQAVLKLACRAINHLNWQCRKNVVIPLPKTGQCSFVDLRWMVCTHMAAAALNHKKYIHLHVYVYKCNKNGRKVEIY